MLERSRTYRTVTAIGRTLSAYVRGSYFYRWLTAEPDPDVIVIDLRETWTVGPFIAILDRLVGFFERAAGGSTIFEFASTLADRTLDAPVRMAGFAALFAAVLAIPSAVLMDRTTALLFAVGLLVVGTIALFEDRPWDELRETRPVELLVAAFEPPDPPSEEGSDDRDPTDDGESA